MHVTTTLAQGDIKRYIRTHFATHGPPLPFSCVMGRPGSNRVRCPTPRVTKMHVDRPEWHALHQPTGDPMSPVVM